MFLRLAVGFAGEEIRIELVELKAEWKADVQLPVRVCVSHEGSQQLGSCATCASGKRAAARAAREVSPSRKSCRRKIAAVSSQNYC